MVFTLGCCFFCLKKRRLKRGRAQIYLLERKLSERNRLEISYQQNRKLLKSSAFKGSACGTVVFIFLSTFSLFDPLSWTSFPLQRSPYRYRTSSFFKQLDLSICVNTTLPCQSRRRSLFMENHSVFLISYWSWPVIFKTRCWDCTWEQVRKRCFKNSEWNSG